MFILKHCDKRETGLCVLCYVNWYNPKQSLILFHLSLKQRMFSWTFTVCGKWDTSWHCQNILHANVCDFLPLFKAAFRSNSITFGGSSGLGFACWIHCPDAWNTTDARATNPAMRIIHRINWESLGIQWRCLQLCELLWEIQKLLNVLDEQHFSGGPTVAEQPPGLVRLTDVAAFVPHREFNMQISDSGSDMSYNSICQQMREGLKEKLS